ncbi:MAG: NirD/YgiW/YdeI family stress tolerance protein [Treponema sp.]|jgi:uncharacterized protein (TIGR00156 family)|nr:NirD/YgiW/YdeI family stress tolerance protein [Treponema sp.]
MKHKGFVIGITSIIFLFTAISVSAQGFTGPGSGLSLITISEANKLRDHSPVLLRGNIIRSLDRKKEKFMFKDNTGEVVVEIDWHIWNGLSVNENDTVEIFGYIDKKGWWIEEIEVKSIKKL